MTTNSESPSPLEGEGKGGGYNAVRPEPDVPTEAQRAEVGADLWSCGHTSLGTCGECHRALATKAAVLATEIDLARDVIHAARRVVQAERFQRPIMLDGAPRFFRAQRARAELRDALLAFDGRRALRDFGITSAEHDVLAERRRQVLGEGFGADHDDAHVDFDLTDAAIAYAMHVSNWAEDDDGYIHPPDDCWPWAAADFKPKDPRRDLVRAAALLLAEIDRLDRALLKLPSPLGGEGRVRGPAHDGARLRSRGLSHPSRNHVGIRHAD